MSPIVSHDANACAQAVVARVGKDVRIAVPIGIGKPIALLDALYRMALADPSLRLSVFTGLTLTRPPPKSTLEARFVGPLLDRVLGTYAEPLYVEAQRTGSLPANVTVQEFFLQAGVWSGNSAVQRSYTSLNYSEVAAHLQRLETNTFAQLVAPDPHGGTKVSLGSNADVTLDMVDYIKGRRDVGKPVVVGGEIHPELPYMGGRAELDRAQFDVLLEPTAPRQLFAAPKQPVSFQDYAMALHAATLVRDGGTLQIGIGTFGDALAHALVLRHTRNDVFRAMLDRLGAPAHPEAQLAPFEAGLYGCTEMLVDGYLALLDAGILARVIHDGEGESVLDAGFFVGNATFYRRLRDLDPRVRARIRMCGISHTNTLDGDTAMKRRVRAHARFVNTAMVVTLLGAASSDATASGHVVSGVGGQLDLVLQAHRLADARSIIAVRSTRAQPFRRSSNIVFAYANCTVPRSLRDIVVSEYGIADVRGRSDRDTCAALVGIADAHFQDRLVREAQRRGKLEPGFRVAGRANTAQHLEAALQPFRRDGHLPLFPLGTEMTPVEEALVEPLGDLAALDAARLAAIASHAFGAASSEEQDVLARLALARPSSLRERALRRLVLGALRRRRAV